jgi:hypothetical protein
LRQKFKQLIECEQTIVPKLFVMRRLDLRFELRGAQLTLTK